MTLLTRLVEMIWWMMLRWLRPSPDSMVLRTAPISTPRWVSALAAMPSSTRRRPSSRCSVPMYEWCERSASSWASVSTFFARSVNRSNGYKVASVLRPAPPEEGRGQYGACSDLPHYAHQGVSVLMGIGRCAHPVTGAGCEAAPGPGHAQPSAG